MESVRVTCKELMLTSSSSVPLKPILLRNWKPRHGKQRKPAHVENYPSFVAGTPMYIIIGSFRSKAFTQLSLESVTNTKDPELGLPVLYSSLLQSCRVPTIPNSTQAKHANSTKESPQKSQQSKLQPDSKDTKLTKIWHKG
jgi:hypothetical protein